jgi:hypothetical protein
VIHVVRSGSRRKRKNLQGEKQAVENKREPERKSDTAHRALLEEDLLFDPGPFVPGVLVNARNSNSFCEAFF